MRGLAHASGGACLRIRRYMIFAATDLFEIDDAG
jgi:hypothetical protein